MLKDLPKISSIEASSESLRTIEHLVLNGTLFLGLLKDLPQVSNLTLDYPLLHLRSLSIISGHF